MPSRVKVELYRIAQEALNNIVKHANCKSITIQLNANDDQIVLEISDDGDGFDINEQSSGFGLQSMQERAKKVNARLVIISVAGKGTYVKVEWKNKANT
jgi:signal transduction histidine kinase